MEVSDGSIEIPHAEKCGYIEKLTKHGTVLSEVGSKDAAHIIPPYKWIELMKAESDFIDFFRDADLVICDTMYSLADSVSMKEDWGHSSNIVAIDLCHQAAAKRLVLFHHEPTYDDEAIARMHQESIRYEALTREQSELDVLCAYDGLEIQL